MQVIQRLTENHTQRGVMYTIAYFLYDTEKASNTYDYGDDASSWTGVSGSYVYSADYKRDKASQHWRLYLTAISGDYNWPALRMSEDTQKSMSNGSIIIYPSWFGARVANAIDESNGLRRLSDGAVCKAGEYIFNTATSSDAGQSDYSLSPFTVGKMQNVFGLESSPNTSRIYETLNQKPVVWVYSVEYSDSRAFSSLELWTGTNGTFGSGLGPTDQQTGMWKALSSSMRSYKSQSSSTKYRVTRTCQSAPLFYDTQMIWDPDKNGGTWTW